MMVNKKTRKHPQYTFRRLNTRQFIILCASVILLLLVVAEHETIRSLWQSFVYGNSTGGFMTGFDELFAQLFFLVVAAMLFGYIISTFKLIAFGSNKKAVVGVVLLCLLALVIIAVSSNIGRFSSQESKPSKPAPVPQLDERQRMEKYDEISK